jgi:hypothetical protein
LPVRQLADSYVQLPSPYNQRHFLTATFFNMRGLTILSHVLPISLGAALDKPSNARQGGGASGNISLQYPELFSLRWHMLEQNSISGFETPMVDFLSGSLKDKGLTVELQPVQNPILAYADTTSIVVAQV